MARKAKKTQRPITKQNQASQSQSTTGTAGNSQLASVAGRKRSLPLDPPNGLIDSPKRQKKRPSGSRTENINILHKETLLAIQTRSQQKVDGKHKSQYRSSKKMLKQNTNTQVREQVAGNIPLKVSPLLADSNLPTEVRRLTTKYEFTSMHIISSSKMQQKIGLVLERISRSALPDMTSKPGVVILYADAAIANKMISVVEIVKKEVERLDGSWYQYTKLESRMAKSKPKTKLQAKGRQASSHKAKQLERLQVEDEDVDTAANEATKAPESEEIMNIDSGSEHEDAFETMTTSQHGDHNVEHVTIRRIPVMIIYIARVPISGLKDVYG